MTDQIDTVNPANIPASWDGLPAARITVFASPRGQWFDLEGNNAGAGLVATAIKQRFGAGYWSGIYVNQSTEADATAAIEREGLHWTDAEHWPAPGVYEWCADPSGNIARGSWVPPVTPVAVQDRYPGPYDLSRLCGPYTGRVAGYIDGPQSEWPAAAWDRFTAIPDAGPIPPLPTHPIGNGDIVYYILESRSGSATTLRAISAGTNNPAPAIDTRRLVRLTSILNAHMPGRRLPASRLAYR